jgi:hypothetical protein
MEYLAVSAPRPNFVHRHNVDGTTDSFCRKCFATVASSQWEVELDRAEQKHLCDPVQLEYMQRIFQALQAKDTPPGTSRGSTDSE